MEDKEIVKMFKDRDESAIAAAQSQYGSYCGKIAFNILNCSEDSEECVNEAMLRAWNSIPPHDPENLAGYLGKITRNLAISLLRKKGREKRGGKQYELVYEELSEVAAKGEDIKDAAEYKELVKTINDFLDQLPQIKRQICILRYRDFEPVADIAVRLCVKESYVLTTLSRTRKKLKIYLEKRGFTV